MVLSHGITCSLTPQEWSLWSCGGRNLSWELFGIADSQVPPQAYWIIYFQIKVYLILRQQLWGLEVVSNSLQPHGLYSLWNSPGQDTGVGSLSLLKRIFPTWRVNPGLLHCRRILYQLSHKASPRILEWVAYPFSSGSFWYRNRSRVSCIAGRFFINWYQGSPK